MAKKHVDPVEPEPDSDPEHWWVQCKISRYYPSTGEGRLGKEMMGPVLARPSCQGSNMVLNPETLKSNDKKLFGQQTPKQI